MASSNEVIAKGCVMMFLGLLFGAFVSFFKAFIIMLILGVVHLQFWDAVPALGYWTVWFLVLAFEIANSAAKVEVS